MLNQARRANAVVTNVSARVIEGSVSRAVQNISL